MQASRLEWWPSSHLMTAPNPFCLVWCSQHLLPYHHIYAAKQSRIQCTATHGILGENWGSCNVFVCMWQSRLPGKKWICWCFTRLVKPILFHINACEQIAPRNINPVFSWPQKAGAKWGQGVNLGLELNSPAVIVGSSESVKDPAAFELEWGHAEVSRPRWSAEQWGEGEWGLVYQLRSLLTEAALHWHQSELMTVLLLCSVVRSEMNRRRIQCNKRALACIQEQEVGILILLYHGQ